MCQKTWLTQKEEAEIKETLINFIKRVSSTEEKRESEIEILPLITQLLLNNMVETNSLP